MMSTASVTGNERVLAAGTGITIVDGGPGNSVSIQAQRIPLESRTESDSTFVYYAVAPLGSSTGASVWRVFRRNKSTNAITRADGNKLYDNVGSGLAALTYL